MSEFTNNEHKTPYAQSMHKFAGGKVGDGVQALGKGLPCTVVSVDGPGIVTVNFAVATTPAPLPTMQVPVAKPPYVQYPIQPGDIGVVTSADVRLGGLTGLGGGTPNLQDTVGNLSGLWFTWLGHKDEAFLDPEALALNGNITCTPAALGFFAKGKVSKQSLPGPATDLASTMALANAIRLALINYGLA